MEVEKMKKVSFEEIGAVVATFLAGDNAKKVRW